MKATLRQIAALAILSSVIGCAPSATQTGPEHTAFLSQQGLEGRIVLIEFGQIGCAISEQGLVKMQKMLADNSIPGLSFMRVEESPESASSIKYYNEKKVEFPVYYDADTSLARTFESTVYPCFVIVDKFGGIRYRGGFPPDELPDWIASLAAEVKAPEAGTPLLGVPAINVPEIFTATVLPEVSGGDAKPLSKYAGKNGLMAVLVDTECPFAGQTIKEVPNIATTLEKHDIAVILVNIGDEEAAVKKFYTSANTATPVVYDTTAATHEKLDVHSVPTVILISADNELLYKGSAVWGNVAAAIEKSLDLGENHISFSEEGTEYG